MRAAPATEIVQELIPEEGAGLVRELGYARLPNGVYDTTKEMLPEATRTEYEKTNPGFVELLDEFKKLTADFDTEDKDFNEPRSILTVAQEQPHLKRIQWDITWKDAKGKDGEGQKFPCPRRRGGCGRFGLALLRHLPKQGLWLASCAMPRGDGAISKLTVISANFVRPEKRPGTAIWAF